MNLPKYYRTRTNERNVGCTPLIVAAEEVGDMMHYIFLGRIIEEYKDDFFIFYQEIGIGNPKERN